MYNNTSQATLSPNELLLKAADYGDLEGVKKAIEDGASLDHNISLYSYQSTSSPYSLEKNPLLLAIKGEHEEIAKYLLCKCLSVGTIADTLFKIAKTDEMKLLIAEKSDSTLFTRNVPYDDCNYGPVGSATSGLILKSALQQYRNMFQELGSEIKDKDDRLNKIQDLLEEQNLAIAQIQSKNELIAHQNEIILQLNQTVLELKGGLSKLQEQVKSLSDDKTLTIEINDHERQLQELKQEVTSLKVQLSKSRIKDKPQNAVTMQALARGFLSRKQHSLTNLKEQRKSEIQTKLPEAMSGLAASGRYEEITKLAEAMKHERLHQAMQIVRGKPEREIAAGTRKIRY